MRSVLSIALLLTLAASVPGSADAQQSGGTADAVAAPAELPRVTVSTAYPSGGRIVRVGARANLQSAIDAARPGDVLLLPAGASYVGNFVLRNKGAIPAGAPAAGWIVLRTDVPDASLGAAGTRMTPSRSESLVLARIFSSNYSPAIATEPGAHHWRLTGVEIGTTPDAKQMNMLVRFGEAGEKQRTIASMPHHLVVDRSYVHGSPTLDMKRCIALNSATSAVIDSWLAECHSNAGDSQAVVGYNGTGPFKIENNHLEAGHEVVMFGGSDPGIQGLVPSDIELRGNHLTRPLAWKKKWGVKNLVETKNARRMLVEGNVLENNWSDGQGGYAFVLKSENQDGAAPWSTSSDIVVRYNLLRNVGAGFNLSGLGSNPGKVVPAARFLITHNLIEGMNTGPYSGLGVAVQILSALSDAVISHNTFINPGAPTSPVVFDGGPAQRLVMHSNVFNNGQYGVKGSDAASGNGTLAKYAPGGIFKRNALVGGDCSAYPASNVCPEKITTVGFVSLVRGDYRAGPGALKGRGLDGGDIGADFEKVTAATRGAIVAP